MHFSILFTSFFAGVLALPVPVPQAGAGLGDVLSGTAQGTSTLESGGAKNLLNSAGNSAVGVSDSAGDLVTRQVGAGTGDVLSGAASGVTTLLSSGTNNLLNSGGNSVTGLTDSAGTLINRSPKAQVGVGTGDVLSGTASGVSTLLSGGTNNLLNSGSSSVTGLTDSAGTLVNRSPEAQVGTGAGDVLSGTADGTKTLESGGTNNLLNSGGSSVTVLSDDAGTLVD